MRLARYRVKEMNKNFLGTVLLLTVIATPALYFLLAPGFYEPHDLHHIADIFQMYRAFESGQLPPRLGPDFTFGFGYPLFNFYYVLPFYIGSLVFFLTKSLTGSFEFVFILSVLLSVYGMYLFLREFIGRLSSLAGALLFLYTPYRALQIYVRGAMGEALALALMPFVFWGIARLIKNPTLKWACVVGIISALFLLSHNYFWLLALPWLTIFCTFLAISIKKLNMATIKYVVLACVLGAGISAYWWFPAFAEYRLVSLNTPFKVEDHFPFIKQLVFPSWGYGPSIWGPNDDISFQIGVVNLGAVFLSITIFLAKFKSLPRKERLLFIFGLLGFSLSVLLMNIRSLFVWKILPIYQFIQFPWRFLAFTTFFSSFLLGVSVETLQVGLRKVVVIVVIFLSILLTIGYFRPSKVVYKEDDYYLSRMFANITESGEKDSVSNDYREWSEDYLLLPLWVKEKPKEVPQRKIESASVNVSNIQKINPVYWTLEVASEGGGEIYFNSYYFPGWVAEIDGRVVETEPFGPQGKIKLVVPEGDRQVSFYWGETKLRKAADFVSLFFLALTIWLLFKKQGK